VGATDSHTYTVIINPVVSITTTTLPDWPLNQPGYYQTISVLGRYRALLLQPNGRHVAHRIHLVIRRRPIGHADSDRHLLLYRDRHR